MNNEELDIFYKVRKNFATEDAARAIEEYADDTVADQIDPAEVADEFLENHDCNIADNYQYQEIVERMSRELMA